MANYIVTGFCMGVMDIKFEIENAKSKKDAIEKAKKLFKSGDRGYMHYSDDDAAAIDFDPSDIVEKVDEF